MMHFPTDKLSASLLHSIPRKVFLWVRYLGLPMSYSVNNLSWEFLSTQKNDEFAVDTVKFGDDVEIQWNGNLVSPDYVSCNDPRVLDLSTNLAWFVSLEQKIYNSMEEAAQKILEEKHEK